MRWRLDGSYIYGNDVSQRAADGTIIGSRLCEVTLLHLRKNPAGTLWDPYQNAPLAGTEATVYNVVSDNYVVMSKVVPTKIKLVSRVDDLLAN